MATTTVATVPTKVGSDIDAPNARAIQPSSSVQTTADASECLTCAMETTTAATLRTNTRGKDAPIRVVSHHRSGKMIRHAGHQVRGFYIYLW